MIGSKLIAVALMAAVVAATSTNASEIAGEAAGLGALGGLMGGLAKGSQLGALGGLLGGAKKDNSIVVPTKSQEKTEVKAAIGVGAVVKKEEGFLGVSSPGELIKLMLNPFEFASKIAKHFKVSFDKFFPLVTKGLNFGLELAVQPLVLSFKIIEKVFVPDFCKLKFACKCAKTLSFSKAIVPTLSDKVLSESKLFRSLSDGIHGQDCEAIYPCNGPLKIKEEYKDKKEHQHGGEHKHEHEHHLGLGHNHGHGHEHEGGHKGAEGYLGEEKHGEHQHGSEHKHEHEHHHGHEHEAGQSGEPIYAASSHL